MKIVMEYLMTAFSLFLALGSSCVISATMAADGPLVPDSSLEQIWNTASPLSEAVNVELTFKEGDDEKLAKIIEGDNVERLREISVMPDSYMNYRLKVVSSNLPDFGFGFSMKGIPIIHYAAMCKALRCFKFLLLNGANPRELVSFSMIPMTPNMRINLDCASFAGFGGEFEILKILEERGMDCRRNLGFWFFAGLAHQNVLLNKLLKKVYYDQGYQCLNMALFGIIMGNYVKEFTPQKTDFAWWGKVIQEAQKNDLPFNDLLCVAVRRDQDKIGEWLISKGADINAKYQIDRSLLMLAIEWNSSKMFDILIEAGANVNLGSIYGDRPLHAASVGKIEMFKTLISKGADISVSDNAYMTPLHIAAMNGSLEIADILITKNADVNAPGPMLQTPLHCAATRDMVEFLISKEAKVNAIDGLGRTPLHCAAEYGFPIEVCAALIKAGADIHAKDENGRTPFDIASEFGASTELLDILNPQGANHSVISEQSEQ